MLTKLVRKLLREWKKNRKPLYFINKKHSHDMEINENNVGYFLIYLEE